MKALLKKELKQMMKEGAKYHQVDNFIKDFSIDFAWVSEINELSTSWKLSIKTGGKFEYIYSISRA